MSKRLHFARRDRRTICFQLAMPIFSILIAMLLAFITPGSEPKLWIDAGMYQSRGFREISAINVFGLPSENPTHIPNFLESYRGQGYAEIESQNFSSAADFSVWLMNTFASHGSDERYIAVSPQIPGASWWNGDGFKFTTLFANASAVHSAPQSLTAYVNARRASTTGVPSPTIRFGSHPFPFTEHQMQQIDAVKQMLVALFVMIPFTFIPSTYVAFIVKERHCKAKHLQFVSGAHYTIYWIANLLFDSIAYALTAGCVIGIFFAFQRNEFIGDPESLKATVSVLFAYGTSGIAAAYCVSFLFENHSAAQNTVMIVNFIVGFCLVVANFVMQKLPQTDYTASKLVYVFRCWPAFCLGEGIMNIALTSAMNVFLTDKKDLFDIDVIGSDVLFMAGFTAVFVILTLLIDHPLRKERQRRLGFQANAVAPLPSEELKENGHIFVEDVDVTAERDAVNRPEAFGRINDVITVNGLRKVYPPEALGRFNCSGKNNGEQHSGKVAVRNITFGVRPGEVFGFLGTNGAGKTTTMSVLTGEFVPTMGEVSVCGFDIVKNAQLAFQVIGYCPQFDALLDLLTPTEHLALFSGLRGIPASEIDEVVDALIIVCGLDEFRWVPAMSLSGGNKRKLSVAISLVGHPKLVFLDEPSAGMDPHARRQLWDVISFVSQKSSVLLTTHHLEEVDVLAHRVGIMDKGLLRCLGSLEHLKNKFGKGFEVTLRIADCKHESEVAQFVSDRFKGSALLESRDMRLVFIIPSTSSSLADLFATMQNAVTSSVPLGIVDYIVQQTSLESVFVRITDGDDAVATEARRSSLAFKSEYSPRECE